MIFQNYDPYLPALHLPNQPNGVVVADENGVVPGTFSQKYDTEAEILTVVLAAGQLAYASDTQSWFVGDGTTAGGKFFKQIPQRKNLYLASLVTAPGLGSATDLTSITFRRSLGATYRIEAFAWFAGESSNLSNFGLKFRYGGTRDWLIASNLYHTEQVRWHNASTGLLLESTLQYTNAVQGLTGLLSNLSAANQNLSTVNANMSIVVKSTSNSGDLAAAVMDLTPVPRTGSTSAAGVYVYATCERIA